MSIAMLLNATGRRADEIQHAGIAIDYV